MTFIHQRKHFKTSAYGPHWEAST